MTHESKTQVNRLPEIAYGVICVSVCDDEPMPVTRRLLSVHDEQEAAGADAAHLSELFAYERECDNGVESQEYITSPLQFLGSQTVERAIAQPSKIGKLIGKKAVMQLVVRDVYRDESGQVYYRQNIDK